MDCVLFMRHGYSKFNHLCNTEHFDEFSRSILDPPLHEKGVSQAEKAAANVEHVKYAFVSPLRRTLQTAQIVLKNNPTVKVIVHPLLREILNNANDIPDDLETIMSEFPNFDFTLIKECQFPSYIHELDPWLKDELVEKVKEGKDVVDAIIEMEKKKHPLESYKNVQRRAFKFATEFLIGVLASNKVNPSEILVVTHSCFLSCFMSKQLIGDEYPTVPHISNCGIVRYSPKENKFIKL